MILLLVLLVVLAFQAPVPVRVGLLQLQMGTLSQGTYKFSFASKLPDTFYQHMIAVSFVKDFATINGIVITSTCPNRTQTGMGCSIYSQNPNKNNIVYISYVASGLKEWIVGTYVQQYTFDGANTALTKTVKINPQMNADALNQINTNQFMAFILAAGISSVDPDFDLNIGSPTLDLVNLQISFSINIKQYHNKTVTITYGYLLFDAFNYNLLSQYEDQQVNPTNIPKGFIYGIGGLSSAKTLGLPPKRLLQTAPIQKPIQLVTQVQPTSNDTQIAANDPANIEPTIKSLFRATNPVNYSKTPSIAAQLLRKYDTKELIVKYIPYDAQKFSGPRQPDGIIQSANLNRSSQPKNIEIATLAQAGALAGTNNQLFNTLFLTNGFVVLTETDLTQTYYTEVIAVSDYIPSRIPGVAPPSNTPVYYQTAVSSKVSDVTCSKTDLKKVRMANIDYIQKKAAFYCVKCIYEVGSTTRRICLDSFK